MLTDLLGKNCTNYWDYDINRLLKIMLILINYIIHLVFYTVIMSHSFVQLATSINMLKHKVTTEYILQRIKVDSFWNYFTCATWP